MSTTNKENYIGLLKLMDVDSAYIEPTLENLRWFIRTGYSLHEHKSGALEALNLAYCMQTHILVHETHHRKGKGTWCDTDNDLQHALQR